MLACNGFGGKVCFVIIMEAQLSLFGTYQIDQKSTGIKGMVERLGVKKVADEAPNFNRVGQ